MKRIVLSLCMMLLAIVANAVPAKSTPFTHTQKDGTQLTLMLVGDEHMHYYQNIATGQAMRKAADGDFVVISSTELSAQTQKAALRRAEANKLRVARLPRMQQMQTLPNGPARAIGQFGSMTGTKKGLVILVNFTDVTFKTGATSTKNGNTTTWDYTGTQTAFNNQFNQQGYSQNGHIGSVKDYFSAQSYGTFTVDFDVVGPVTVSQNMAYYGAPKGSDNDSYPASMVIEACKLADAAGVDFSKYDWTGDGYVDQVFVIYAGYNEAQGASENTIWPHEWDLSSANYFGDGTGAFKLDGKWIKTYACTSELAGYSGTMMDGIGTACHEFSHCLGYPDLYDTDYAENGSGFGMSYYDLMASGSYNGPNGRGEVPCGYSAYERWMAGWITPTELNADAATITNMVTIDNQTNGGTVLSGNSTLANSPSRAYIIKNGSNDNYYLLENRPNTGYFKYYHNNTSGSGLFITHVNYNASAWQNNTVNAYGSNQRFIFIPADGTCSNSSGYTTDFFPTSSVKSFTEVANKQVTNITKSNGLISFDYNGGFNDTGDRFTITLDACGGSVSQSNWTQESYKQSWTLPEPKTTVPGWSGIGWLTYELNTYKSLDDILDDVIDYGEGYIPQINVTLYAVYADNDELCHSRPANYTVNLNAGSGSCSTTSWSQNADNRSLTLPSATISIDGWTFAGWTTESVTETNSAPSTLYAVGETYKPTSNATLYAVYKKIDKASGDNTFRLSTTLTAGNRYVFVTSNAAGSAYAISKENLLDLSTSNRSTTGVAITVTDSRTVVPTDAMIWTCSISNGEINLNNGTDYLGINGNGIGKRSTAVKLWWSSDYGLYGKNSAGTTSYYAKVNNSTIQTATTAPTTGRIYAYEAAAAGSDIITYNSNPEPGEGGDEGEEPGDDDDDPLPFKTYYSSHTSELDGKNGQALELALTSIIYTHTKRTYDNLWTDFKTTDVVPNTTDQIYDMYSSNVYYYSTASHLTDFNREHAVPNSWWGGESGNSTAYTDLHHLVPSDQKANNKKNNYPLGCGHGLVNAQSSNTENSAALLWSFASTGADSYGGGSGYVWEPEDQYKGDFARMYLYVVCAYEGNITWQTNYMFTSDGSNHTTIKPWAKELLLKWHRQDPVSDKERARNNAVYGIQGNRNPFIDYPEFAEYIWGDKSSQTFSLSSAQSAYSAEYIAANPDLTDTGNGDICNDNDDEPDDPIVPTEPGVAALYFPHIAKLGQPFTAPAFTTDSDGAQTWTSSNTTVATVDNEGHVTIHAVGTTIITVTQAETATYKQGTASYMIKVVE